MLFNIVLILGIIFSSIKIEKIIKIPMPLSLMVLSIIAGSILPNFLTFTNSEFFAEEMIVFIVLLVAGDAFILKLKELKENWLSIFILSSVFVVIAILLGVLSKELIFGQKEIGIGALIALFAMITATDPVSVISVFKMNKVPHKLAILAEGESLFNDAMALTMFSAFGLYLMGTEVLTLKYGITVTLEIFSVSTVVGIIIGLIGLMLLKTTKDLMGEFILILFIAYTAYLGAEHIHIIGGNHLSGLLAEIVAILTMTTVIDKSYEREQKHKEKTEAVLEGLIYKSDNRYYGRKLKNFIGRFTSNITDIKRQHDISTFLSVLSILINGILFVSLAHIINFEKLYLYKYEIIMSFALTTIIRAILIGIFSYTTKKTGYIKEMNVKWYFILLFAGIKGGLSIVMLHMMNAAFPEFEYKEMFESIVIGVILLTTFIYVLGLMITFSTGLMKEQEQKSNN